MRRAFLSLVLVLMLAPQAVEIAGASEVSSNKALARQDFPHPPRQSSCRSFIYSHESGWHHLAVNPSSGAGGIPQRMPPYSSHWLHTPRQQLAFGERYVRGRFNTWCAAKSFWLDHGWF